MTTHSNTITLSVSGSVQVEDDYMELLHTHKDPAMLWVSTPEDQFPNPHSDLEGFLSYCGENMEHLTASLWLVTREMVEKGEEIKPLATHKPFLLSKLNVTLFCRDAMLVDEQEVCNLDTVTSLYRACQPKLLENTSSNIG